MLPYILLAEDDCDLCGDFVQEVDRHVAYAEVKTVENGRTFLDYLASRPWDDLPSMILVKYDLPDTKAPDLLRELMTQARYQGIPVLVWSRSGQPKEAEECQSLGVRTYLHQPTGGLELEAVVHQIDDLLKAELNIA